MSLSVSRPAAVARGKAAVLSQLAAAGFVVPEFVVSPPDLAEAAEQLGYPLAVRSSASLEDGRQTSFAGLFHSALNIATLSQLEVAVQACRQSVDSPGVREYCQRHGIEHGRLHMDVIIQRMVEPRLAGVAFTVNPMTGAEEVVIEACTGLAQDLMSGQRPPLPAGDALLERYREAIEQTARRVMRHFGAPQDVEFAIADGQVHVLQARPITRITFAPEIGEWTNADFRDGGVSSRVCSPLMASLYELIWDHALKASLRELRLWQGDFVASRMFFGRPYWNIGAVKRALARLPGFVEREFDDDLSVQAQYEGDGIRTPVTLRGVLRAVPTLLAIRGYLNRQETAARGYLAGGYQGLERDYDPLPDDVEGSFRRLIERDYFALESCYFRTIFAASLAKLDFKMSFPEADYASLMAGLPAMRHMEPVRALRAMAARGEQEIGPLVEQYRHQSRLGIDIIAPRWDEDQSFVEALLTSVPAEPIGADPTTHYHRARAQALARIPRWRRRRFLRKLERLRNFVWLREELRDLSSRMYYHIRRHVLEIARRRGLGDDIFFMSFREIIDDDRSQIERGREVYDSYRNDRPPNEIGARYAGPTAEPPDGHRIGIGASPGVARGRAHVARSVDEALRVEPGDVLICPFIDPGWTPVLDRVAAVVTETGGLLSHAAVICREYGIPAVLGVAGVVDHVHPGAQVEVDGGRGRLRWLD